MKRTPPRPPQAILFDLYGTLVPNFPPQEYDAAMVEVAEILVVDARQFRDQWRRRFLKRVHGADGDTASSIRQVLADLGIEVADEILQQAAARRLQFARELLDRSAEALPVLHSLRQLGIPLALVSDCTSEVWELWDEHPLFAAFSARSLSCELRRRKPAGGNYWHALRQLQAQPERSWYVGDGGSREFTGAQAVGLFTICFRQPGSREFVIDEDTSRAEMEIEQLADLLPLVSPDGFLSADQQEHAEDHQ